jgi:hypothetical protein
MQQMEQQVERIVSNARKGEEEKGLHGIPFFSSFFDLIRRHLILCSYYHVSGV